MANELINIDTGAAIVGGAAYVAKDFFKLLIKTPAEEFSGMIGDRLRERRAFLQIKSFKKLKEKCAKDKINPADINLKVLYPYLEAASVEEDETLQEAWTNLMVNYIDPKVKLAITVYPKILSDLSSDEVAILNELFEEATLNNSSATIGWDDDSIDSYNIKTVSKDICDNLERLALIKEKLHDISKLDGDEYIDHLEQDPSDIEEGIVGNGNYYLTSFGINFIEACTRKN